VADDGLDLQALPRRPGSSRYQILPSINQVSNKDNTADDTPHRHAGAMGHSSARPFGSEKVAGKENTSIKSQQKLQKDVGMSGKRGTNAERKVAANGDVQRSIPVAAAAVDQRVLAVKLPSGQRIEHRFQSTKKLFDVLRHVETVAQQRFTGCKFVSADRKTVLTDLNVTIASSGILTRTLLHLHLPDET